MANWCSDATSWGWREARSFSDGPDQRLETGLVVFTWGLQGTRRPSTQPNAVTAAAERFGNHASVLPPTENAMQPASAGRRRSLERQPHEAQISSAVMWLSLQPLSCNKPAALGCSTGLHHRNAFFSRGKCCLRHPPKCEADGEAHAQFRKLK